MSKTLSTTSSFGDSGGRARGKTRSRSRTEGRSQSTVFVTDHQEFPEETGRQFRSLEEEWEKLVARLFNLDRREALIKVFNRPTLDIHTPEVERLSARRSRRLRHKHRGGELPKEVANTSTKVQQRNQKDLPDDFRE